MQKKGNATLSARTARTPRHQSFTYAEEATAPIAVIGLGYVGLPLAIAAAEKGLLVIGFDNDKDKVKQLNNKEARFLSEDERAAFKEVTIDITSTFDALQEAKTFIICVPTPVSDDHLPDLSPLVAATRTVAAALKRGDMVIVESSVSPGVCGDIIIPILELESDLSVERDFAFVYCPERVNPGDKQYNTKNIPRVIGGAGPLSLERGLSLYASILDAPLKAMKSLKEAEAVKMVENSFRDVNIAFANELAMAFDKEGIDVVNVIDAAATKPFGFMAHYPGSGVGGHCIPVDPYYLIHYGLQHGFVHRLLITAREINNYMPHYTLKILTEALEFQGRTLATTTVTVLGLAYKPGITDTRESPAMDIYDGLKKAGASVRAYDPLVPWLSTASSLESALNGAQAVILATNHDAFLNLTARDFEEHGVDIVIDGRNALEKASFAGSPVSYYGIGR